MYIPHLDLPAVIEVQDKVVRAARFAVEEHGSESSLEILGSTLDEYDKIMAEQEKAFKTITEQGLRNAKENN